MKKNLLIALVVSAAVVCFVAAAYDELGYFRHGYEDNAPLPPGYTMSCNGAGLYIPVSPHGVEMLEYGSRKPFKNRGRAVWRAWEQYNYLPRFDMKYNFPQCE